MKKFMLIFVYVCFFGCFNFSLYGQDTKFPLPDSSNATMKETFEWLKGKFDGQTGYECPHCKPNSQNFSYDLTAKIIIVNRHDPPEDGWEYFRVYKIPVCNIIGSSKNFPHHGYNILFDSKVVSYETTGYYRKNVNKVGPNYHNDNKFYLYIDNLDDEMYKRLNNAFNHLIILCKQSEKF